jgi:hypothetical protein
MRQSEDRKQNDTPEGDPAQKSGFPIHGLLALAKQGLQYQVQCVV